MKSEAPDRVSTFQALQPYAFCVKSWVVNSDTLYEGLLLEVTFTVTANFQTHTGKLLGQVRGMSTLE